MPFPVRLGATDMVRCGEYESAPHCPRAGAIAANWWLRSSHTGLDAAFMSQLSTNKCQVEFGRHPPNLVDIGPNSAEFAHNVVRSKLSLGRSRLMSPPPWSHAKATLGPSRANVVQPRRIFTERGQQDLAVIGSVCGRDFGPLRSCALGAAWVAFGSI